MKKKFLVFLIMIMSAFVICGCSDANTSNGNMDKALSVDDILNKEGVYCLHEDGTVSDGGLLIYTESEDGFAGGVEPLVIDRTKGDQLIYVGDMVSLYTSDSLFEMDNYADKYYTSGKIICVDDLIEFEGEEVLAHMNEPFNSLGFEYFEADYTTLTSEGYIVSTEPTGYTYGYYEGTEWIEDEDYNDIPFYWTTKTDFTLDYVFEAPVLKGKDGYFIIDLNNVKAGIYHNEFDNGDCYEYIIEII